MEMYEHSLIYGHVKFAFWGYGDKKEFVAFQPVDEGLFINQKTLSTCLFWQKKKKGRRRKKNIQLKLSYNLYIKKMYVLSTV